MSAISYPDRKMVLKSPGSFPIWKFNRTEAIKAEIKAIILAASLTVCDTAVKIWVIISQQVIVIAINV